MGKGIKDFGHAPTADQWDTLRRIEKNKKKKENYRNFMNNLYQQREREFRQATNEWNKIYKYDYN